MHALRLSAFLIILLGLAPGGAAAQEGILVNGQPLSAEEIAYYGVDLPPGRYWYDPVSGLWGAEGSGYAGQTVAGLAHTIKNLLMGLEGGMYMVDSGLRRGDAGRIADGWQILQRNFEKTTAMVKDFLSFAKGRLPERVELRFLESGFTGSRRPTLDETVATECRIRAAAGGIRRRDFPARPTFFACSQCPFREICPHTAWGAPEES